MIQELYESLLESKDVEYEVRLGYQTDTHFRSTCSSTFFDITLNSLKRFTKWDRSRNYICQDVFCDNIRYRRTSDGRKESIQKKKIKTKTYPLLLAEEVQRFFPTHARISIAREDPVEPGHDILTPTYVREKEVHEFVKGNFCYVLSRVRSGKSFETLGREQFEAEIEMVHPLDYIRAKGIDYVVESVQMKLKNLLQGKVVV